ncbi:cobalamin B12-binding domain-containing protein [Chitinophaga vietnamensis]|uniref:cobalamin B12-binding domain-containing protein n=1 Tax=Chitinophaga vietnamensis TaxID=2593957 RepID=UPI001177C14A|nr:cobalamin-dependent protein [Chitinophaga vietnamensis]
MKPIALLTTIPSDSHNWNLVYIQLFLQENGFEVVNLGPSVPYDLLLSACVQHQPDLLIVSTINGHGYIEGKELIRQVRSLDSMKEKPVFIGGKLSTDVSMSYLYAVELEEAGYNKAYCNDQDMEDFTRRLQVILRQSPVSKQV